MSDAHNPFLAALAANATDTSYAGNATVLYARDPGDGVDIELSTRNLFPGMSLALSFQNVQRTTEMDLKRFPESTRSAFASIALALGKAIGDQIPPYYISTEFCSKKTAAYVHEFAAGKHLVGRDEGSHALQRVGLALATVVDSTADLNPTA
jgi:hypothetical protein